MHAVGRAVMKEPGQRVVLHHVHRHPCDVGRGGLGVQLVYYRGAGEARASRWVDDAAALKRVMTGLDCRGGRTQIGRVLDHAIE